MKKKRDIAWANLLPPQAYCLYNQQQVDLLLDHWAESIYQEICDSNPLVISVLTGGVFVTTSLVQRLPCHLELDYVHATRYHGARDPQQLIWRKDPDHSLLGRTVLLVDDVLDGGVTLQCIVDALLTQKPKRLLSAVFVDKQAGRVFGGLKQADFTALFLQKEFIIGMGMDYANRFRHIPELWVLPSEG